MAVIKFPSKIERENKAFAKSLEVALSAVPEPYRTDVVQDISAYYIRIGSSDLGSAELVGDFTPEQVEAIRKMFDDYGAKIGKEIAALVIDLSKLRIEKAVYESMYGHLH